MKFATPTLLAILASSAFVSAAPSPVAASESTFLVKKSDVSNALSIIEELGQLNQKRALIEDENELFELSKRTDSLLSELISALTSSGLIKKVWTFLTTDSTLRTELVSLIKKAVSYAITDGPTIIKAVYNSGYIQELFSYIYNNASLRSSIFTIAKSIFGSGLNLLKTYLANKSGTTTTAASTTTAAAKREVVDYNPEEYYDKRSALTIAESIYTAIKNTGLVQSLVTKVLADPTAAVTFLETALKEGLIYGKELYSWAESSGVLASGITWIKANGLTYAKEVALFVGKLIEDGSATVSEVDSASTTTTSTTTTATTLVAKRLY